MRNFRYWTVFLLFYFLLIGCVTFKNSEKPAGSDVAFLWSLEKASGTEPGRLFQVRMTLLSFIAYCKSNEVFGSNPKKSLVIKKAIEKALQNYQPILGDWELVWGPAVNFPLGLFFSDALVYIVREKASGDCALVVRGTNPFSLWTWVNQDLQVNSLVNWEKAVAGLPVSDLSQVLVNGAEEPAPGDRAISLGTFNSLAIHTSLIPEEGCPGAGTNLLEFLTGYYRGHGVPGRLYYTGHSLGGLMAPTLALWVQEKAPAMRNIETWIAALAGLTAGNSAFASYSSDQLDNHQDKWLIRYANPLDMAVNVWAEGGMARLMELYRPILPILDFPGLLALQEQVKGKDYAQVGSVVTVKSEIDTRLFNYRIQAIYQHVMPYLITCFGEKAAYEVLAYIFELSFKDMIEDKMDGENSE